MIARVFPRRTKATPRDLLAFIGNPPRGAESLGITEVRISVVFSWDKPKAEKIAEKWRRIAPVQIGGPAYGMRGEEFVPGLYMKPGYTITSRGCSNHCWFCHVPNREGELRELPINPGNLVTDDNFLACSMEHILKVAQMLKEYRKATGDRPRFVGGLEANLLTEEKALVLRSLRPKALYFAYDTQSDREPLFSAGRLLMKVGFTRTAHSLCAFCLIGYRGDTFEKAEGRLADCWRAGFLPYAMLYRGEDGSFSEAWKPLQREWNRPQILAHKLRGIAV